MSMVSAKEFAHWLMRRFESIDEGVSLTREDINQLTGRQNFSLVFINDIHYELMRFGIAFVTDTGRDTFYLVRVFDKPWRTQLEHDAEKELLSNVVSINLLR